MLDEWNETIEQLAITYSEMCEINETPTKEHTEEQVKRLKFLRKQCVDIHNKRILINVKNVQKKN